MRRHVRELQPHDVDRVINYFLQADHDFIRGMGADPEKLPKFDDWRKIMLEDLDRSPAHKHFYYLIWELEGCPVGHSNINKIVFGHEAYLHLHLWEPEKRRHGNGTYLIRASIGRYFENFELQNLFCEPYALNPAPNKILAKIGFEFVKQYDTIPGWINFHQTVNRWVLSKEKWLQILSSIP